MKLCVKRIPTINQLKTNNSKEFQIINKADMVFLKCKQNQIVEIMNNLNTTEIKKAFIELSNEQKLIERRLDNQINKPV